MVSVGGDGVREVDPPQYNSRVNNKVLKKAYYFNQTKFPAKPKPLRDYPFVNSARFVRDHCTSPGLTARTYDRINLSQGSQC
jgi:hypothetical protein